MKKMIRLIMVFTFSLSVCVTYGQQSKLKKADKKFEDLAYIDAVEIYESVVESGYENVDLYRKLGDANYFNAKYFEAAKWYGKLFALESSQAPEYSFRYGQSLKSIGNYKDADTYLSNYFDSQGMEYMGSNKLMNNLGSDRYTVEKVSFNSRYSEYPAFVDSGQLYVVAANSDLKKNVWNNEPTSDIFTVNNTDLTAVSNVNTNYNEGSMVISNDGNTLYFTRNDFIDKKLGKDIRKITRLKLYRATKEGASWVNIEELPFNNSEYSVGHPALNADGTKLYFVSDKPGGKGGTDIYQVNVFEDGGFSAPANMASINTPANEMFPFVDTDNTFYFSSNGHPNLGGLDVFMSKADGQDVYMKIHNIGTPVNSKYDDFAYVVNGNNKGYFASNRDDFGSDDIYSFKELRAFEEPCFMLVEGVIKDKKTGAVIPNAVVSMLDTNNEVVSSMVADSQGKYSFSDIDCKNVKFVRAEKVMYLTDEVTIAGVDGSNFNEILMDKRHVPTETDTDIGLLLNPIYFDLGKSDITHEAKIELEKVFAIMKQHPNLKIDVRSHTDSRASDNYNMSLSDKRAKSTIQYLIERGIDRSRLTGRGYGETQLINECSNGVKCSDFKHLQNRRSEFIIVKQQ